MRQAIVASASALMVGGCQWVGGADYVDQRSGNPVYAEWCRGGGCVTLSECAYDEERKEIAAPPWNKLRSSHDNSRMTLRHYHRSAFYSCVESGKDT